MTRLFLILTIYLTVFSLSAHAGDTYISGNIGVGTANENIESISSISGYVEYNFRDNLAIRGSLNHYAGQAKVKSLDDGEFEMLSFESSFIGKVDKNTGVIPYFGFGAGYYLPENNLSAQANKDASDIGWRVTEEISDAIGFHVVTGVILNISDNADFEFCLKYIILSPDVKLTMTSISRGDSLYITDDVNLNTVAFNCGLRFKF